ncbi:MAG TPA: DUF6364 family protein [Thermoanaerobaculia bacterium]|nr:DUF6364 family protein [Thermoanaerobaculia bacterium]
MTQLTVAIEEDVLDKAKTRAEHEGTSLNDLVRDYLTRYAATPERERTAITEILELARKFAGASGGTRPSREELHDRAALR